MGQITSSIGLVSGINTQSIIDQLIALEGKQTTLIQSRIDTANAQKDAYTGLATQFQSLKTLGMDLERPSTFTATTANSSDENVLTATTSAGAAAGSYEFQVARLVTSQQSISSGFASATSAVGAGTITVEMGGGGLQSQTALSELNGGAGVRRGIFRITDRSGKSSVIDVTAAVSLDDVVKKINTALDISVHATVNNDHLVLTDATGQNGTLSVQDLADGHAAQDLGITRSASGDTLTGANIHSLGTGTAISALNDGRGIRTTAGTGDFTVTARDGTALSVTIGAAQTVGDVISAINRDGHGKFTASIDPASKGITLTDTSGGTGNFSVAASTGSNAAKDLGLLKSTSGATINGDSLLAGIDTVLVSSLKGGTGLPLGQISVTNRSNQTTTVDLSGAQSVQDILDRINNTSGVGVSASLNQAGNGIQIQDTSGGGGNLVIGDVNSTTAAALGIAGTFNAAQPVVNGGNLQLQWVSENSLLSSYNAGKGVTPGSFQITNSAGAAATVDLSQGTFTKLGDVISAINAKSIGVTASVNANGDGLLLTDTAAGSGKLSITNLSGTTATDLNIAGTATGTTIDGTFEKSIAVTSADTLATVQTKLLTGNLGVSANIVNDGSGGTPYRLSLTALNSGRGGRFVFDAGTTSLGARTLVQSQDAAVFLGGTGTDNPLLITGSKNQFAGIIPGVTLSLHGVSNAPVSLNISRDPSTVTDKMQKFTDGFNAVVTKLADLTKWDSTKNAGGLLLGDGTVLTVQTEMYSVFQSFVAGAGRFRTLADVGFSLGDGSKVTFDADKFNAAFGTDPDAVKNLFAQAQTGLGALIDQSMTKLVDPVSGVLTQTNQTLDSRIQGFQSRIDDLNKLLADKRTRLETQFANMESVLAQLQTQQQALSSLTGISTTTKSSTSK